MGNNERGWARLVSQFGRVTLIQQGMIQHVEIWEAGQRIFNGPDTSMMRTRFWDEVTFSSLTFLRSLTCCRKHMPTDKIDVIIAANYSCGLAALWMRLTGHARKVVLTLSDFLPFRGSLAVRFHRRITAALTTFVAGQADEVWAVSPRIPTALVNPKHFVFPICLDDHQVPPDARDEIGYIGFPSFDHALDILFDVARRHQIRLNIIGQSPYLDTIRHLAPPDTKFHGTISDPQKINAILAKCFCGYAVYRNTGIQSYSYYGIPSKSFHYFADNIPVVTTNTADFTTRIEKFGVGRVVQPVSKEIEQAILQIKSEFQQYYQAINQFRNIWNAHAEQFHRERFEALGLL